jgi:hypothetical protein
LNYKRGNPGCCLCGGGGVPCPACVGLFAATKYLTIPALGVTSIPIIRTLPAITWGACFQANVLGYSLCGVTAGNCAQSTVSTAFGASLLCTTVSGVPVWQLLIAYQSINNYPCGSGTILPADYPRAMNTTCGTPGTCWLGASSVFGQFQTTNTCVPGADIVFSSAPGMVPFGVPNLYFGTSATVSDTP